MRYVALLRGINVGGNNMIKMERLRETFTALGFENVKTYINSGNIAFDIPANDSNQNSPADLDQQLSAKIHDAIQSDFGFNISTMVRSLAEINEIIENNPYLGQFDNHKYLHVFFLAESLTPEQEKLLLDQANEKEFISVMGRTVYYLLKISILDSALGKGFLDKKLKIPNTGRNWRTVQKLAEL